MQVCWGKITTCMYALTEFTESITAWRVHKGRLLLAQYWVIIIFLPLLTVLISISSGIPNHTASIQVNLLLGFGSTEWLTMQVQKASLDYLWFFHWNISEVKHSVLGLIILIVFHVGNSFKAFLKILFSSNKTVNWFSGLSALFSFPLKSPSSMICILWCMLGRK